MAEGSVTIGLYRTPPGLSRHPTIDLSNNGVLLLPYTARYERVSP